MTNFKRDSHRYRPSEIRSLNGFSRLRGRDRSLSDVLPSVSLNVISVHTHVLVTSFDTSTLPDIKDNPEVTVTIVLKRFLLYSVLLVYSRGGPEGGR